MKKYSRLVIDGHNLYHRCYNADRDLSHRIDGRIVCTGGVYGFLRSLRGMQKRYCSSDVKTVVLFDNAISQLQARRQLDPNYKNNRADLPRSFYRGVEYLQLILLKYDDDLSIVYRHNYEADDLVETVLSSFDKYQRSLIVSTDLDWARSIRENVHWLTGKEIYDSERFESEYGFYPSFSSLSFYKAFKGDASDNIKNPIPRFPWDSLSEIISRYSDMYDFYDALRNDQCSDFISESWREKLLDHEVWLNLKKNYELVSFPGPTYTEIEDSVFPCRYKRSVLRMLYASLGFNAAHLDSRFAAENYDETLLGWDVISRA